MFLTVCVVEKFGHFDKQTSEYPDIYIRTLHATLRTLHSETMTQTMKILSIFGAVGLSTLLTLSATAQYGGGGYGQGGYGQGGYGRGGMGGMSGMNQQTGPQRPMIPNIAGDMANKETKWLKENLSLDKEQAKAVKKLNNEYAGQQQEAIKDMVGKDGKPGPEIRTQIQQMMMMLNEEKEDQLKTLLTPEQWTTYQAKKPEMQKEIGGFRPPAPKGMAPHPDSTQSAKQ